MADPAFDWKDVLHSGGWIGYIVVIVWGVAKLVPIVQESWGKTKKNQAEIDKAENDAELKRNEDSRVSLKFLQERLEQHVLAIEKNQASLRKVIARLEEGRSQMMADLLMERSLSATLRGSCESLQEEVNDLKMQVADLTARLNAKDNHV